MSQMQKGQYVQPKNNFPVEDYDENARAVFALRTKNVTRTRLLLWNGYVSYGLSIVLTVLTLFGTL